MTDKELTLEGSNHVWHVVVHQMTLRMQTVATRLGIEASQNPVTDPAEQVLRGFFYPIMAACTTCEAGPLPTVEEFLDLPVNVCNLWYTTVRELNPEALPEILGGAPGEVSEEKKENSLTISTSG